MPKKDHHMKPYDQGTLTKLEIFERYVESWLPTFIMQKHIAEINIVDFFAGIGYDENYVKGSPIRFLDKINKFYDQLIKNHTIINLYLNEYIVEKFEKLKTNCENYLENNKRLNQFVRIHYFNQHFNLVYPKIIDTTKNSPNLYILDQCGVEFTKKENFNRLSELNKTDFLFFISSSYFNRFASGDSPDQFINMNKEDLKDSPYKFIHRTVLKKYRSLIPSDSDLNIFPFSIKKGANIYGIIFGSKHISGVDKFLKIAWNKNKINGEADYDIDEDEKKDQYEIDLNSGKIFNRLTKIETFHTELENYIKEKINVTNIDLYYFTYISGHISKHTTDYLKILKKQKKIEYNGYTRITWKNIKNQIVTKFQWIG